MTRICSLSNIICSSCCNKQRTGTGSNGSNIQNVVNSTGYKSIRSSRRSSRYNRHKPSCWRHPFVVFTLSFITLGSLRFRTRTKRVAKRIFSPASIAAVRKTMKVEYRLVEDGVFETGDKTQFQRYEAYAVKKHSSYPLTVVEWLELEPAVSIAPLSQLIRESQFQAVFWETPAVTSASISSAPFEFVLVDAPSLAEFAKKPDEHAFANQFAACDHHSQPKEACQFTSLGGDAELVAPIPVSTDTVDSNVKYAHLKAFCEKADKRQVTETWALALNTFRDQVTASETPRWLSTSGMGIAWLHFRIDTRPKYYTYRPFKRLRKVPETTTKPEARPSPKEPPKH